METDNEITALRKQIRQLQQQQAAASQTQQQNTANPSTIDQESNTTSIFISTLRLLTFVVYEGNVETLQNS
jgi:cell shape-determining protein MreC